MGCPLPMGVLAMQDPPQPLQPLSKARSATSLLLKGLLGALHDCGVSQSGSGQGAVPSPPSPAAWRGLQEATGLGDVVASGSRAGTEAEDPASQPLSPLERANE